MKRPTQANRRLEWATRRRVGRGSEPRVRLSGQWHENKKSGVEGLPLGRLAADVCLDRVLHQLAPALQ
jgi:hypothetical protein